MGIFVITTTSQHQAQAFFFWTEPGPGAWLEPPMLPSSSSDSMQSSSPTLPGSKIKGKLVYRSAGAPVLWCTIGTLHESDLLLDCRARASIVGESKTTGTVESVLADQNERKSVTNLGGREMDSEINIKSNPKGADHTLTQEYPSTQPEEVTQKTSH